MHVVLAAVLVVSARNGTSGLAGFRVGATACLVTSSLGLNERLLL